MKTMTKVALAVAVVVGFAASLPAGDEVTVSGDVMCAKCALHKADKCQDVLVSTDASGAVTEYYIEKTDAAAEFGHVCQNKKSAVVTGTLSEKDGKTWIAPTKMVEKTS